jgi:hypothetical protein
MLGPVPPTALLILIGTLIGACWFACPLTRPIKPRKESLWPL